MSLVSRLLQTQRGRATILSQRAHRIYTRGITTAYQQLYPTTSLSSSLNSYCHGWNGLAVPGIDTGLHTSTQVCSDSGLAGLDDTVEMTPRFSDAVQSLRVGELVRSYRIFGHLVAQVDPLHFYDTDDTIVPYRYRHELDPTSFEFTYEDLGKEFYVGDMLPGNDVQTLRNILDKLRRIYCGSIGYEYTHVLHYSERKWLHKQTEAEWYEDDFFSPQEQKEVYEQIVQAETFEKWLGDRFPSTKRFGVEGAEALLPILNRLVKHGATHGFSDVVLGTAHRGRLNVMNKILDKPTHEIFAMFLGQLDVHDQFGLELFKWLDRQHDGLLQVDDILARKDLVYRVLKQQFVDEEEIAETFRSAADADGNISLQMFLTVMNRLVSRDFMAGDVKYHLGGHRTREFEVVDPESGEKRTARINVTLAANPSHLEAVCPVVAGMTKAIQDERRIEAGEFAPLEVISADSTSSDFTSLVSRSQPKLDSFSSHRQKSTVDYGSRNRALGILVHGDAGFSGQGVVAETFCLSELEDYHAGGMIHIVVNNQIGFTTPATHLHSSTYPTDIAKTPGAPILHVNGDDIHAVLRATDIAFEFRRKFQRDVVIDLWCYRRFGHNELDTPELTQPLQYQKIAQHPSVSRIYGKELSQRQILSKLEMENISRRYASHLEDSLALANETKKRLANLEVKHLEDLLEICDVPAPDDSGLQEMVQGVANIAVVDDDRNNAMMSAPPALVTGVDLDHLRQLGRYLCEIPDDFTPHPFIVKFLQKRSRAIEAGKKIDWATAEALVQASLISEGIHVRLSGQDSQRGTFNQRHSVLHDQKTGEPYKPLNHGMIRCKNESFFDTCNSPLSETGVLGFEYGYSLLKHGLVMWEAQFGDFANVAQYLIDTFLANGESKWEQSSSIVLLLPHGLDGQGPDHSSARIERFLQLASDDLLSSSSSFSSSSLSELGLSAWEPEAWDRSINMVVVNCTTPAQYFHVLRRQALRQFKKPLIIFTPKFLLHHAGCTSTLEEMSDMTTFQRLIPDDHSPVVENPQSVRRVVLVSGKIYYNLKYARRSKKVDDIAIVRVEQLCPFPVDLVEEQLSLYPNAEVVWCQEEPANMAAWTYVEPRINSIIDDLNYRASPKSVQGKQTQRSTHGNSRSGNRDQHRLSTLNTRAGHGTSTTTTATTRTRAPVTFVGRMAAASPAHASYEVHRLEVLSLLNQALGKQTL